VRRYEDQAGWQRNGIDWALEEAKKSGRTGIIYGFGGFHRYSVLSDGRVRYIEDKGPREAEKAKELGFELI
jgi:hypothetical protein